MIRQQPHGKHRVRRAVVLPGLIFVWIACAHGADKQREPSHRMKDQAGPPTKVCSHDNQYCVQMIPTPGHPDECTLRVSANGTILLDFKTMGYLLDVFFSPDNAYVAINNRRANSGDYLWAISLRDRKAIKMPDDVAEEIGKKETGRITGDHWPEQPTPEIVALCATCTSENLNHSFLFSTGWTTSGELKVVGEFEFSEGWIGVNILCRTTDANLSIAGEKVVKETGPSELVRRAWTWSPFHSE